MSTIHNKGTAGASLAFLDVQTGADLEIVGAESGENDGTRLSQKLYRLIRHGSFASGRRELTRAFLEAGGKDAGGQPLNIRDIVVLCLEIASESFTTTNVGQHLKVWFDPFTGRLHLAKGCGQTDCLTIWTGRRR